jgi:hypothetical protein
MSPGLAGLLNQRHGPAGDARWWLTAGSLLETHWALQVVTAATQCNHSMTPHNDPG